MSSSRDTSSKVAEGLRERHTKGGGEAEGVESYEPGAQDNDEKEQKMFGRTPSGTGKFTLKLRSYSWHARVLVL